MLKWLRSGYSFCKESWVKWNNFEIETIKKPWRGGVDSFESKIFNFVRKSKYLSSFVTQNSVKRIFL